MLHFQPAPLQALALITKVKVVTIMVAMVMFIASIT
jgi:hypothetical protein